MQEPIEVIASSSVKGIQNQQVSVNQNWLLFVTSDKGLCASFNSNIIKNVREHCEFLRSIGEDFHIFCIGKKGYEALASLFGATKILLLSLHKNTGLKKEEFVIKERIFPCIDLTHTSSIEYEPLSLQAYRKRFDRALPSL